MAKVIQFEQEKYLMEEQKSAIMQDIAQQVVRYAKERADKLVAVAEFNKQKEPKDKT